MLILQNKAIDRKNIDDAILNNLNAGYETGIVKSYNNFNIIKSTSNVIAINTGILLIFGCPVKNTDIVNITFNNFPATSQQYKLVAELKLQDETYSFRIFYTAYNTPLTTEDLYVTGTGTYQKELARFTLTPEGIDDLIQTVDVLINKGGTGGGSINIGKITTITQEPGTKAVVDIENRLDEETGIVYTDFNFGIPEGKKGLQGDTGDKGDAGVSVTSIAKTATSGLVDTYTITLSNGNTSTFTVTNGEKGDKGETGDAGFNPTANVVKSGNVTTITITDDNGTTTAQVEDGAEYTLPYASETVKGGVRVWTTIEDGETVLNIATED